MQPNEQITGPIIDIAYRVHTQLGPGLLESVYETVFAKMLEKAGFHVERQSPVSFEFEGIQFVEACRVDLLVEKKVVIELKALEALAPVHKRQLLTYLRLLDLPVGLLINFGAARLNDGLHRILNSRSSSYSAARDVQLSG
jgi:iron complex transport system substrate-binding protein